MKREHEASCGFGSPAAFKIFLYHYPDLIKEVAAQKVDLYCAGHTHGGQVALPLYGRSSLFQSMENGMKRDSTGKTRPGYT